MREGKREDGSAPLPLPAEDVVEVVLEVLQEGVVVVVEIILEVLGWTGLSGRKL